LLRAINKLEDHRRINQEQQSLSHQGQGIPGPQENANPLAQAPITGIKVKPPNNASNVSPLQKTNMTGALP